MKQLPLRQATAAQQALDKPVFSFNLAKLEGWRLLCRDSLMASHCSRWGLTALPNLCFYRH